MKTIKLIGDEEGITGCLSKDKRLSDVVAKYFGNTEKEVRNFGTNGMFTHVAYTRTDEFTDSVLCAISSKFEKRYTF